MEAAAAMVWMRNIPVVSGIRHSNPQLMGLFEDALLEKVAGDRL